MSDDVKKLRAYAARLEREIAAANEQIETLNEEQVYLRNELAFAHAEGSAWALAARASSRAVNARLTLSAIRRLVREANQQAKKEIADAI